MDLFSLSAMLTLDTSEYEDKINDVEKNTESLGSRIGGALGTIGKVGAAGMAASATAVVALTKQATDGYAQYEQLVGGVETLFGTGGKSLEEYAQSMGKTVDEVRGDYEKHQKAQIKALTNADKAYKTAGLSANKYMELSTSFAAALVNSLDGDTEKAVDKADLAITDMSDNVNKMGSSVESVQNAYNGFAKGNFTMLDNLKLGYGGTKEEMQRLLDKAGEISGYEYDIHSYADIVDAIHVVQEEMGITGTTAQEADKTISGSAGSMAAAWENLVTSFGRGSYETWEATEALIESVKAWLSNIVPTVVNVLGNIAAGIKEIVPMIAAELPGVVAEILPKILASATQLIASIASALPGMLTGIWDTVISAIGSVDWVGVGTDAVNWITSAFDGVIGFFSDIFTAAADWIKSVDWGSVGQTIWDAIVNVISGIVDWATGIFTDASQAIKDVDWIGVGNTIWDLIVSAFSTIRDAFSKLFASGKEGAEEGVDWVSLGDSILGLIISAFDMVWDTFRGIFEGVLSTIKDIDWKQLGQDILDSIGTAFHTVADVFFRLFEGVRDKVLEVDWAKLGQDIFDLIGKAFIGIAETFQALFEGARDYILKIDWVQLGKDIFDAIGEAFMNVAGTFQSIFEGARDWIKDHISWSQLGTDIWELIKSGFTGILDFFTGLFDFSNIHIKLPHFTVTWNDWGWVSTPSFGVEWYAKAKNQPYMFSDATLFGAGEAGDEVLYGRGNLMNDIKEAVASANNNDKLYNLLLQYLPEILNNASKEIVLDDGTLVGRIDSQLGWSQSAYRRGA